MRQYIGLLSIVYIMVIIVKLKDNKKSFERYISEYEELKLQLKLVAQKKNPFIMMKFTTLLFYVFLFLYYIANLVLFDNYLILHLISYGLILTAAFKLFRKLNISSLDDFENLIYYDREEYSKKQKLSFILGLLEFAYAFNALSLLSFYR